MKPDTINLRSTELVKLAKEINEREEVILSLKVRTFEAMAKWLVEASLQGEALNRAKKAMGHGRWLEWVKIHCPFAHDTANRYISAAANYAAVRNLNPDLGQLEIAAKLIRERKEEKEASTLPPYLEAIGRVTKLVGYITKTRPKGAADMFAGWPDEGKAAMRRDLEPVAKELWPERF
jgi:hypothetical protein